LNFRQELYCKNLEVALWLESDRMTNLVMSQKILDVQRKVVIEEYKETCLNEPYGDVWHHLSDLAFKVHPYRWPTIGMRPEHLDAASLDEVSTFYQKYYCPNNAVLVIAGKVEATASMTLIEKWFADLPAGPVVERLLPTEPPQKMLQRKVLNGNSPNNALYLGFHIPSRVDHDFYGVDLLSDILGNGPSSRLYRRLLREQQLFSLIDCYITGTIDPGLLVIEAQPADGVSIEQARLAIWAELNALKTELLSARELEKVKNKVESTLAFSEMGITNKASNLAFFEILGNAELINQEAQLYRRVNAKQVQALAQRIFVEENCSEVCYENEEAVIN
ncbi:MAG: pitrilysin family protein, partial [Bacteroidota bacterium]